MKRIFCTIIAISILSSPGLGRILRVPGEYATIQEGINAAVNGDTVLVAPGLYTYPGNYDIDFLGRAILVTTEAGADCTIIDAREDGRGFVFQSGETHTSVLEGFTIMNGLLSGTTYGGGIFCYGSSPTIRGNRITGCYAYWGGGICCFGGSPTIENNEIIGNLAERGGGIACLMGSGAVIIGNTISDNFSEGG